MKPKPVAVARFLGLLVVASACSLTAYATDPVTDGIVWKKDYPMLVPTPTGKKNITIFGTVDTAKYKDMTITSKNPTYWYVVELKGVKNEEAPETLKKFKLELPNATTWGGSTSKEINKNGLEVDFPGYAPGLYRVKVAVKVKETKTSEERDAKLEKDIPITAP
jgi:hypothetical protein